MPHLTDLKKIEARIGKKSLCIHICLCRHLAPEYIEYGIETEKADVYAFGVVLLELITGCRAMDSSRPKGQQFLAQWARPLLSQAAMDGQSCTVMVNRYLDPRLNQGQVGLLSQPLRAMTCAASLCLRREPETRPSMSKVTHIISNSLYIDIVLFDSQPLS